MEARRGRPELIEIFFQDRRRGDASSRIQARSVGSGDRPHYFEMRGRVEMSGSPQTFGCAFPFQGRVREAEFEFQGIQASQKRYGSGSLLGSEYS